MGKIKVDERGRVLIPSMERKRLGIKPKTEFELIEKGGILILKPIIPMPVRVKSKKEGWGRETFLDAGDATFGE